MQNLGPVGQRPVGFLLLRGCPQGGGVKKTPRQANLEILKLSIYQITNFYINKSNETNIFESL